MFKKILIIMVASSLIASCGFHLRGKYNYAEKINPLAIVSEDRDFREQITSSLQDSGLQITETVDSANAILEFVDQIYLRDPVSLDARGRSTRFNLEYKTIYQVVNQAGEVLMKPTAANAKRVLDYDASQVLQTDSEEEFLKEQMYEDMVQSIARKLSRVTGDVIGGVSNKTVN